MTVSVVPVDFLFVAVELHGFGHSSLAKGTEDDFLLAGRQAVSAAPPLKVGVAAELADKEGHERVVLFGEHLCLKVGESTGVHHRFVVAEVRAGVGLRASEGIDEAEVFCRPDEFLIGQLVQTSSCQGTVGVLADGVVVG